MYKNIFYCQRETFLYKNCIHSIEQKIVMKGCLPVNNKNCIRKHLDKKKMSISEEVKLGFVVNSGL